MPGIPGMLARVLSVLHASRGRLNTKAMVRVLSVCWENTRMSLQLHPPRPASYVKSESTAKHQGVMHAPIVCYMHLHTTILLVNLPVALIPKQPVGVTVGMKEVRMLELHVKSVLQGNTGIMFC